MLCCRVSATRFYILRTQYMLCLVVARVQSIFFKLLLRWRPAAQRHEALTARHAPLSNALFTWVGIVSVDMHCCMTQQTWSSTRAQRTHFFFGLQKKSPTVHLVAGEGTSGTWRKLFSTCSSLHSRRSKYRYSGISLVDGVHVISAPLYHLAAKCWCSVCACAGCQMMVFECH